MHRIRLTATLAVCLAVAPTDAVAAATGGGWTSRQAFQSTDGDTIRYFLFTPDGVDKARKYPLVLWLHGGLKSNGVGGPNLPTGAFYQADQQAKHPCFVLRPVAIRGHNWVSPRRAGTGSHALPEKPAPSMTAILELLEKVLREEPVDATSVHVTGASMGGYGVWDVILRHPEKFASAVPICGGGDPDQAERIKDMKIWIFHSADDNIVPAKGSREMFHALMKARGEKPDVEEDGAKIVRSSRDGKVRYTEYRTGRHNAWDRAFRESDLMSWMFGR